MVWVRTGKSKAGAALCNQSQVSILWGVHTAPLQLAAGVTGARDELTSGFWKLPSLGDPVCPGSVSRSA